MKFTATTIYIDIQPGMVVTFIEVLVPTGGPQIICYIVVLKVLKLYGGNISLRCLQSLYFMIFPGEHHFVPKEIRLS